MRFVRLSLRSLLWLLVTLGALLGSLAFHTQLPIARRVAAAALSSFVSGEIRGELLIGRFDDLTPTSAVARHVILFDGEGRRIIVADRVELKPELWPLFTQGTLLFRHAKLTVGTVRLIDDGTGTPTLLTTFDTPEPQPGEGAGEPFRALLETIEIAQVTVYGELLGLRGLRVENVQARGSLAIDDEVEIAITEARGQMVEPFDFIGEIERATGSISTLPERGIRLHAQARRGEEHADVHVAFHSPRKGEPEQLDLVVEGRSLSPHTLREFGYEWIGPIDTPLSGRVRLHGKTDELAIEARVQSNGGEADLTGSISEARGVSVRLETERIALDQVISAAPALILRGSAELHAPPSDEPPRVRLSLASLRYADILVPAFELEGAIEEDQLRIDRAHATRGNHLVVHGRVSFDGATDLHVDARFAAMERDPNLSRFLSDAHGALRAQVRVKTLARSKNQLDVSGRIVLTDFHYQSIRAQSVTLVGSARGDLELPVLDLAVTGQGVSVLEYALGSAHFAVRGAPRRGYTASGEFEAAGQKTFTLNATIAADRKGMLVQADPIEFSVGESTWRGAAKDLRILHGHSVELGLLRLASRSQRLEAQGIVRFAGEDAIQAQLQNFDLVALHALLGPRFPLSEGHADATVEIQGDLLRPELLLQGALRGAKVADMTGVDALYFVTYKNGQLELDGEVNVSERGLLRVTGTGQLDPTIPDPVVALRGGRYELELASDEFDLTLIPALRKTVLGGRVSGSLAATGTLDEPSFDGEIGFRELQLLDVAPLSGQTRIDYAASRLEGDLRLSDAQGELGDARGSLTLDWKLLREHPDALREAFFSGEWKLAGQLRERRLDRLPITLEASYALPVLLGARFELARHGGPADGFVRFIAKSNEVIDDPACNLRGRAELRGLLAVRDGGTRFSFTGHMNQTRFASGQGEMAFSFDEWLEGKTQSASPHAKASGRIDIDAIDRFPGLCGHGKGDLHVSWSADSLFTTAPTAELQASGSYSPRLRGLEGRQRVSVNSCSNAPVRFDLQANANAQELKATGEMSGCGGGPMHLSGRLPLVWMERDLVPRLDDTRDLRAEARFERAQLRPLLDRLPGVLGASAVADGELVLEGRKGQMRYLGQLSIENGTAYAIAAGQELREISVRLVGNGNWAKIEYLRARAGSGSLEAQGGIGFHDVRPERIQIALLLDDFPVEREGSLLAALSGSAALSTDIGQDKARTAVKIHSLSVRLPSAATRSLQSLDPHPDVTLTTATDAVRPEIPYIFEFFVDGRQRVNVRRSDFQAVVATELAVSYREPELRVGGYVEFQRGTFEVLGKEFELNRGSMRFDGTAELNPEVNLVATHQLPVAGSSPVVVVVTGTLAHPQLEFFSDTCPGDGAVVMLVSGRCPTEDPSGTGDAAGAQDAFAAGLVGGILTLGAKRELGGLIPRISVESTGQGTSTRVKAGFEAVPEFMRSLVQRVYVQGAYSMGDQTGADGTQSSTSPLNTLDFLIELYFPHNIVGRGTFAPESWGLDVTWEP